VPFSNKFVKLFFFDFFHGNNYAFIEQISADISSKYMFLKNGISELVRKQKYGKINGSSVILISFSM